MVKVFPGMTRPSGYATLGQGFAEGRRTMSPPADPSLGKPFQTVTGKAACLSFRASGLEGLSRVLDPPLALRFRHSLFSELASVLEDVGGLVSKTDDSGLTALFDAGRKHESHCLAAVEGAVQLLDRFDGLTLELRDKGLDLQGKAGISWGAPGPSTLSAAEALESLAGPDGLLVAPEVAAMSGCRWIWEKAPASSAEIEALRRVGRRESGWFPFFTPDHPAYRDMMDAHRHFLEEGAGASGGVALIGKPGLGKNGMAESYASLIAEGGEPVVACGGLGPWGALPMGMWRTIRGSRPGPDDDHIPSWLGSALKELAGTRQRAVVLLQDLHCADESSLRVLSRLIVMPPDGLSLFFILVGERLPEQIPADRLLVVTPEPMSPKAIESFLREMLPDLGEADLPDTLARTLHEYTMGYPLFVQQTFLQLLSSGCLARSTAGEWTLEEPLTGPAPSMEALLQARMDALPGKLRQGLLMAGLLGRNFSRDLFLHLHEAFAGPGGDSVLLELAEAGFLSLNGPLCRFRESLLAETAAGAVSENDAKVMHGIAGNHLSRVRPPGPDEAFALETAGHLVRAGRYGEAMPWALAALEQMTAAADCTEALQLLERLRRWPAETKSAESERRINKAAFDIHSTRGDYREAMDLYALLAPGADPGELARLDMIKARMHSEKGETLEAAALLEGVLAECGEDGFVRATVLCRLSVFFAHLGDMAKSRNYQDLAMDMVNRDPGLMECILGNLAITRLLSGDPEKAEELCRKALKLDHYRSNLKRRAQLLSVLSIICMRTRREREGMELSSEAVEIHRQSGNLHGLCRVLGNTGTMLARSGRLEPALEALGEALHLAKKTESADMISAYSVSMGNVLCIMNRFEESEACFRETLTVSEKAGNSRMMTSALMGMGCLHQKTGALDKAEACFRRVLRMNRRAGSLVSQALALMGMCEVTLLRGKPEDALQSAEDAGKLAAAGGDPQLSVDIRFLSSRVLLALDRRSEALDAYRKACLLADEHGITIAGMEIRETLEGELREKGLQISTSAER